MDSINGYNNCMENGQANKGKEDLREDDHIIYMFFEINALCSNDIQQKHEQKYGYKERTG